MSFAILGIGTALPQTVLPQSQALELARVLCSRTPEQETWLPAMFGNTGIETRHVVHSETLIRDVLTGSRESRSPFLPTGEPGDRGPTTEKRMEIYSREVAPLAVKAGQRALQDSGVASGEITHLVTVSCTGFSAPGVDQVLVQTLELLPTVKRAHVGYMGCHGAINGLRVASAFAHEDPKACVLLCAVELCSLHYHYGWDPQRMIANALFGDGAAAVVGRACSQRSGIRQLQASWSAYLPRSAQAMSWTIGDYGFEMTLSKRVPSLIVEHLRPTLTQWLAEQNLSLSEVRTWIIHPGGPRILDAVEASLELPPQASALSRSIFARIGNVSSPSVLFILERALQKSLSAPAVMLAFGPGLVAEVALFHE